MAVSNINDRPPTPPDNNDDNNNISDPEFPAK
jgi:hypothetical protein